MLKAMSVSKAWRAALPPALREDQLAHIERWASLHCAIHVRVWDEQGRTFLWGLDSKPRSAASHARTLRGIFKKYAIDTRPLQGHWLRLVTTAEILSLASGKEERRDRPRNLLEEEEEEPSDDVRLVRLY